ncbi:MAG: TonB-dependent receptor [Acidobacteria bacterium]|nr:TonB-dependent receptor [Acidobacteriota bacterium]
MAKRAIAAFCFAVLVSAGMARAQSTTGTVSGVVKDTSGAVLPGVTVTITSKETGARRSGITSDSGYFTFPQMDVGLYELQAELGGFNTAVLTGINLRIGQEAIINPVLKVGEISERITVMGEAALVETTSATVAAVVDEKKIRDLPLNGRSFTQLAALQEAVIAPVNHDRSQIGNEGQKISINGTRVTQTSFLLDGTEIRNQLNTTPGSVAGVMLGVDTVREFNVVTSVASAEFGRFTGGVVSAVTRSGTNELHASVFEFHRNSALDARNFFDAGKPPNFIRNQFGFTVGGPLRKDRTFFFGSYEGLRDRLSDTSFDNVPNAEAHRGILPPSRGGNVGVDPKIKPYLDTFPLPNGRDNGDGTGEFVFTNIRPTNEHYFMVKIDHRFSDSDSFFSRYTFDQGDKSQLESMALWGLQGRNRSQFVTLEEKKIISVNWLNTARFSFNRTQNADGHFRHNIGNIPDSLKFVPLPDRDFGSISASGIASWGPSGFPGKDNVLNRFEYADTVVWTRGRHSVKFGATGTRLQFNFTQTARSRGVYQFANLRDFLQARARSFDTIFGPYIKQGFRESLFGFFIQDDYRMRPNLTWNLGFRYEFITNPTEVAGRFGNLDHPSDTRIRVGNPMLARNPSLKAFGPRIGLAWSPFGTTRTSVRSGFGIFYDPIMPAYYYVWPQFNAPFFPRVTLANPTFPDAFTSIKDTSAIIPAVWVLLEPKQSYVLQYNLTVQHEILPQTVVSVGYQGSHGVHLSLFADANTALPQEVNGRLFNPPDSRRRNPNFSQMRAHFWDANSFYNAFKLGVQRSFSGGFQFQSAYTYGRSVDDATSHGTYDQALNSPSGLSNTPDDHKFNRGLSSFDVRHSWSLNSTLELPFGPGKALGESLSGLAGKLAAGWQLSGIVTLATGPPNNLLLSFENSRSRAGVDLAERPELKSGASNSPVLSDGRDPERYYDPNVFAVPPAGFFGNLGRSTVIGPGLAAVDFSLAKNTSIGDRATVQFRAEAFNVLNRTNFGAPDRVVFRSAAGIPSATAGRIRSTTTTSRQIQFGLKIIF